MKKKVKNTVSEDFMRDEYEFDYKKGVRGKYYRETTEENGYIKLSPDVLKIFKTSEEVNKALKSLILAIPASNNSATIR